LSAAISSFYSGRGLTRVPMLAHIAGNSANILLDYALIFGKWGCPELGIRGAAIATVLGGLVTPVMLAVMYFSPRSNAMFQTRSTFRLYGRLFRRMIRFGLPSGVHLALDIASFSMFVMLTGRISESALAASNIALSINTLAFMPMIGIGIATSILVGQYQGARQSEMARRVTWVAFRLANVYMLVVGLSFILFPSFYFSLFTDHGGGTVPMAEVLPTGRILLIIATVWGFADAGNLIVGNALKGAGDTRFVMYYSVVMAWGMLATGSYIIVEVLEAGIIVSWGWTALYITSLATGYLLRFRTRHWQQIDVLGRDTLLE
jgi:MATE family multidrug resistance protein